MAKKMNKEETQIEIEKLRISITKLEKHIVHQDEVFPKAGEKFYFTSSDGTFIDERIATEFGLEEGRGHKALFDIDNAFKTEDDARLMREWRKAQKLTWMPEDGESWWSHWDGCTQIKNSEEQALTYPSEMAVAMGNVHETSEKCDEYGKLMNEVSEMKKSYL